jgi:3-hydroxyacyl-CoA dehydrogenase
MLAKPRVRSSKSERQSSWAAKMDHAEAARTVRLEREGNIALVVVDNPPVNASSWDVRKGLLEAIRAAAADPTASAIVIIGSGKTFVAGSDIREFGKPIRDPQLPAVIEAIESCAKPVVAAIHGASLGGGFELALGCDARVATADAVVGLPEVTLGMIPGAGGTQRLPRLTGLAAAIEIVTSGRRVPAPEALRLGMLDAVVTNDLRAAAVQHARGLEGRKRRVGEQPIPSEEPDAIEKAAATAMARAKGRDLIGEAIEAVRNSARLPFQEGLTQERVVFQRLRQSEEAAAHRHLFFAQRNAARVSGLDDAKPLPVHRVGVIGAGTMGAGIAVCMLNAGLPVTLVERDQTLLSNGMDRIRGIYRRSIDGGQLSTAEVERRVGTITPSIDLAALSDADLVIEAVFEDMGVKQALIRELEPLLRADAVLASNTSYLNLDVLAAASSHPARVVGLHFFSPAHVMRLLEIVRAAATAPNVLATALSLGKRIGKVSVVARVGEGFIGNRVYSAYRTQCELMLEEGAYPEDVDAALVAFGFAMGPFAVGDMSGLDIAWRTRQRLEPTRDPNARYPAILDRLCEMGRFGQKTGAGWYRYPDGARRGVPDPEVRAIIEAVSSAKKYARHQFNEEQIQWRALAAMVNESALLLEENIAEHPSDVDLVMVNGYGFPSNKGGPLFWASRRPRKQVLAAIEELAAATGSGFRRGDVARILDQVNNAA